MNPIYYWIGLAVLVGLVVIVVAIRRRRALATDDVSADSPFDEPIQPLPDLPIGTKIVIPRISTICGRRRYVGRSPEWSISRFKDGTGSHLWLSLERTPQLQGVLWTERTTQISAPDEQVRFENREYHQVNSDVAFLVSEGDTGLEGIVNYSEYWTHDGQQRLLIEHVGKEELWRISSGSLLSNSMLQLFLEHLS